MMLSVKDSRKGFLFGLGLFTAALVVNWVSGKSSLFGQSGDPNDIYSMKSGGGVDVAVGMQDIAVQHANISKLPGDDIIIAVTWDNLTTDFLGNPIPWDFVVAYDLFNFSQGNQNVGFGWDTGPPGNVLQRAAGAVTTTIVAPLPSTGLNNGDQILVRITLIAATSDAQGNPTSTKSQLVQFNSTDFVVIGAGGGGSGPASPSGSVSGVALSQRQ